MKSPPESELVVLIVAEFPGQIEGLLVGLADGRVTANAVPLGASSIAIDPQGVTYLGVTAATSSNVVKPAFGQWSNVADGAGPLFAQ